MSKCERIYGSVAGEASRSRRTSRRGNPDTVDVEDAWIVKEKECHDLLALIYVEKVLLL